jgi:hypothetical protein
MWILPRQFALELGCLRNLIGNRADLQLREKPVQVPISQIIRTHRAAASHYVEYRQEDPSIAVREPCLMATPTPGARDVSGRGRRV